MIEETKDNSGFAAENQSEWENSYIPYEPPKLRKHGKFNNLTTLAPVFTGGFDNIFGPGFSNS